MKTREEKLAAIDASIKRWLARVRRASNAIAKLEQRRNRLLKARDPMRVGKMSPAMAKALEIADRPVNEEIATIVQAQNQGEFVQDKYDAIEAAALQLVEKPKALVHRDDDLTVPAFLRRDPNETALKKMNQRIAKRATQRKAQKPVKSRLLARAIEDNERRNSKA